MKKTVIALSILIFSAPAFAEPRSCEEKKQEIQNRINYAKSANDTYRVAKLTNKLDYVNKYCSNEQLAAKRQQKVQEYEYKVKKAELDVQEAVAEGRTAPTIQKKKLKLERAKQKLANAKTRA